ncbi:2-amino-1-hydroxyethylphosphonate dioxygenase (glycine-forming)-like [Rhopilema esculentum]|uniref:2-amino-1-hydroxyethylphosphonate dioxygenase (glycine-forming)-like n=1 Tax=Rhopilema esculentum TaxID=499914 RepID=UPI0031D5B279|eukprot:gene4388-20611_t
MKAEKAEAITKEIFDLYRSHGTNNYLGEDVTQAEHMIQCAMLAEKEGYSEDVILGALFHDIGHLIGLNKQLEAMAKGIGTRRHDMIGAEYLSRLGFPETLCQLVRHHVNAKRYLVHKREGYHDQLSKASKTTLIHQGGPMNEEEATDFEKLQNFKAIIHLREWDDLGKVEGTETQGLEKYEDMCKNFLIKCS